MDYKEERKIEEKKSRRLENIITLASASVGMIIGNHLCKNDGIIYGGIIGAVIGDAIYSFIDPFNYDMNHRNDWELPIKK